MTALSRVPHCLVLSGSLSACLAFDMPSSRAADMPYFSTMTRRDMPRATRGRQSLTEREEKPLAMPRVTRL